VSRRADEPFGALTGSSAPQDPLIGLVGPDHHRDHVVRIAAQYRRDDAAPKKAGIV
jgi:hypothetical protein